MTSEIEGQQGENGLPLEEGEIGEGVQMSNWLFTDEPPTPERVIDLLKTLPDSYGVAYTDFADYVQALPQRKKEKVTRERPDGRGTFEETVYRDQWTLYMSVAGRIKMAEAIGERNDWRLDFEPEPVTPTGTPGFISLEQRIVYREYAVFYKQAVHPVTHEAAILVVGRKPGQAWVPFSGGSNAAGSNPYEKVETAARGRALAAWGIGILPGSGVASLEEMQGVQENREALRQVTQPGSTEAVPKKSKNDLITEAMTLAEQIRQGRGLDEMAMTDRLVAFLTERLGIRDVFDGEILWEKVKAGQVQLLVNSLADSLQQMQNERADL